MSSENTLEYVRGNDALEVGNGIGNFRHRDNKLGDIVNANLLYVKNASFAYDLLWPANGGGTLYLDYLKAKQTKYKNGMLFVGANDGMLHAVDAKTGIEQWAYIPHAVYPYLKSLSDTDYQHHYFVDGQTSEGDAYVSVGGGAQHVWKTLLLGATGAGAKSIFAIDISDPAELGIKSVLWERSAVTLDNGVMYDDMGYVLGAAFVVRLRNAQWAAIYGNGMESINQHAVLYLVDVMTGAVIKKITAEKHDGDGKENKSANGLFTPALLW
ncbi:MAG: PilC/PilY family type IV pilus protein, partial [Glaciimonas sp.]|nr:PilC/PilY family type IV pilus protein [Glaciimonas sp.]